MKTLTNYLFISWTVVLVFIYGALNLRLHQVSDFISPKIDTLMLIDSISYTHCIDSIKNERQELHEKTQIQIQNDTKILQDEKEELLRLDICLDSVHALNIMAVTRSIVCDTLKTN